MAQPLAHRRPQSGQPTPAFVADVRQLLLTAISSAPVVAGHGQALRPPVSPPPRGPALAVRCLGNGPPIVLLHGLAGSHRFWLPAAQRLAQHHQVIVPDLLGFGGSPRPPGGYSPDEHANAIVECLSRAAMYGPAVVAGHSAGAVIALRLAVLRPDLATAVVCFGPPFSRTMADARRRLRRIGLLPRLVGLDSRLAEAACHFACERHPTTTARIFTALRSDLPPDVAADAAQHSWASYSETLNKVVLAADAEPWLASMSTALLIVAGDKDPVADLGYLSELARRHARVVVDVWPDAGHGIPLTHPRACAAVISHLSPSSLQRPNRAVAGLAGQ
jgi:pimeloyl-ACP methyl ester carboxylesterase